jgi:hypothetical protein
MFHEFVSKVASFFSILLYNHHFLKSKIVFVRGIKNIENYDFFPPFYRHFMQ